MNESVNESMNDSKNESKNDSKSAATVFKSEAMSEFSTESGSEKMSESELVNAGAKSKWKRHLRLTLLLIPLFFFAGAFAYLSTLDGDWLKPRLTKILEDKYQAEVSIGTLEFAPLSGLIEAGNIELKRETKKETLDARLERLKVEVAVLPLLLKRLNARTIYISEADIFIRKPAAVKPESSAPKKLDIRAISQTEKIIRGVNSVFKVLFRDLPVGVNIDEIKVQQVNVEAIIEKKETQPLKLAFTNFDYLAREIRARETIDFLSAGDWGMDLTVNGTASTVRQVNLSEPRLFEIKSFDLSSLSSETARDQNDAIWLDGGHVDVLMKGVNVGGGRTWDVKLNLTKLRLEQNKQSDQQRLFFVPVEKIVDHVNERENISLGFKRSKDQFKSSDDLSAVGTAIWAGFLDWLAKEIGQEAIKENKKLGGLLDKLRGK